MLRFASLASGSRGNSLVVEAGRTRVLLDCGLSVSETARRLARLDLQPSDLAAVFVTHEHDDHVSGAFSFAAVHGLPLYLTHGTLCALEASGKAVAGVTTHVVADEAPAAVDGLQVRPFTVPHDAREPVQYVFSDGAFRLGVLSDLGMPTAHVIDRLSGCDALVLECNHDVDMIWGGSYPKWLKERITGPFGHLSNRQTEQLLGALDRTRLQHVLAAHLSQQNNTAELAREGLARAMGCAPDWIGLSTQEEGFAWRELK